MNNDMTLKIKIEGKSVKVVDPDIQELYGNHTPHHLLALLEHHGLCIFPTEKTGDTIDGCMVKTDAAEKRFCDDIAYIW